MVAVLVDNVVGRGLRFASLHSVFTAREPILVGGVYVLAENVDGGTVDDAAVTLPNSGDPAAGALGNVADIIAANANGMTSAPGGELPVFILALEAAAIGAPFFGLVEGYYVDALVTRAAQREPRCPLYATTSEVLNDTAPAIGSPAIGRLLARTASGAGTAVLQKVHFCGVPGGFGIGPGTT